MREPTLARPRAMALSPSVVVMSRQRGSA